jgi:hypothetical protein
MPYEAMLTETVNVYRHEGDMIDEYLARPTGPGPYPGDKLQKTRINNQRDSGKKRKSKSAS